jgi:hypothetical protein
MGYSYPKGRAFPRSVSYRSVGGTRVGGGCGVGDAGSFPLFVNRAREIDGEWRFGALCKVFIDH